MISWTIYIAECIGMVIIFTAMIMIPLYKNPIWWIHDYPEDIQEEYFKTHERIPTSSLSPKVALKKGFALIFVLVIMTVLMIAAGANDFLSAFLLSYGIWFVIDWYDCFLGIGYYLPILRKSGFREQNIWIKNITRRNIPLFILL